MGTYAHLNNVTTAAAYTDATTLACGRARRVNIEVANAAIYFQLGHGHTPEWDDETFMAPGFRSLDAIDPDPVADWVRVRSAVANLPAQVTVQPR